MMKIILNESQYINLLTEYGGNVHGLDNIIKYIITKSQAFIVQQILNKYQHEGSLSIADKVQNLYTLYQNDIDNNGWHLFEDDTLNINEQELNQNGIFNLVKIQIYFMLSKHSSGGFNSDEIYKQKDGKYNGVEIYLEIGSFLSNPYNENFLTLKHELTHMYQFLRMSQKLGSAETANSSLNNKYYNSQMNDFVNACSYYFSTIEQNAVLNELYSLLEQGNYNRYNYQEIFNEDNSYNLFLTRMIKLITYCKNNQSVAEEVFKVVNSDAKAIDCFPSTKGFTPQRYQKRLIQALQSSLYKFKKKTQQIIGTYLMDIYKKKEQ